MWTALGVGRNSLAHTEKDGPQGKEENPFFSHHQTLIGRKMFVVHMGGYKKSKDFEVVSVEGIFIFCSLFYPFMFFFLLCVECEGLSCDC